MRLRPERQRQRRRAELEKAAADVSDAEFVIGQTGEWIRSADTKAGLLFGALAVLLGWLSTSTGELHGLRSGQLHRLDTIALAGCAVLLAVAIVLLVLVLLPRRATPPTTRYAWPLINKMSIDDILELTPTTRREEAWKQGKQLAQIASRKHFWFTAALWTSTGSVICFFAWGVLRP